MSRELSWGHSGGMTSFHEEHTVKACASYGLEHTEHRNAGQNTACANEIRANARVGVDDMNAALAHADVQASIKAAPQLYGHDTRPVDGTVYRIAIEGAVIELGDECNAEPSCKPIPAACASSAMCSARSPSSSARSPRAARSRANRRVATVGGNRSCVRTCAVATRTWHALRCSFVHA